MVEICVLRKWNSACFDSFLGLLLLKLCNKIMNGNIPLSQMDFIAPVITPIVGSLLVPVKRHLGFLVSSSEYVRDMHAKVTVLGGIACDMETKQRSNNVNSLVVPTNVPDWLGNVEKIKERAERIQTRVVGCFNIKVRYTLGKQAYDVIKDVERLMREKVEIHWSDKKIPLAMVSSPMPLAYHVDNKNKKRIDSRHVIFSDALKALDPNNNETHKMALCGMAGVGKTTMMQQLKKATIDRKMFDWIIKVDVGKNLNIMVVQQAIAEYMGEGLTETTNDTRAERLQKRFDGMSEEGKKKILLILDDVWEVFNLKDIGLTSPFPKGFKLLLTSREETVCTQMGVEASYIFKLDVLEEPEAQSLFWEIAGLASTGDIEPDFHEVGEAIVKRCGGLPIAINTIASTLCNNKEIYEWEDALDRINSKNYPTLINIFEFSYQNLKDDGLKEVFLLSGLFPEDYNIVIEDLVRYGWGLKFFKNVHTIRTTRSRVNTCVKKLIRSNLLIKSDREGCVKMHDLVRDFVLSNFSKVKQASIVNHDDNVLEQLKQEESYERILLQCGGMFKFPVDFNYQNLEFLKLMGRHKLLKFPKDLYTRMEKLKVLEYENVHQPLLPHCSVNLRALFIHSCSLVDDDISFLGGLVNLEVLSLANCGIRKLPSQLGNLKSLKLLDLTGCANLYIDDGVFQNLEKLEELYMGVSKEGPIRFTDANCDELKTLSSKLSALELEFFENKAQPKNVSFEKLERFRISIGHPLEKKTSFEKDLYLFQNTLMLVTSHFELLECKVNELFRKTQVLHLQVNDMIHLINISTHPPQHSFCNLRFLSISNCESLAYLFTSPIANGLTKLECLVIRSCPHLKEIWPCEYDCNHPSKLREIKVKDCNSLVNLFPINPMCLLSQLEKLEVEDRDTIEVLFNIDLGKIEHLEINMSNLKLIEAYCLKNLEEVWRIKDAGKNYYGQQVCCFQEVDYIRVYMCGRFKNIITPTTLNFDMIALKNIDIDLCGEYGERRNKLVESCQQEINTKDEISQVADDMSIVAFSSYQITHNLDLVRSISLRDSNRVEVVFELESPFNKEPGQQQRLLLPNLEYLDIRRIDKLTHVWQCSNWNAFFIHHKHQPETSFQNLTTIKLKKCKNIKYLLSARMVKLLSNLKEVMIESCQGMEEVVSNRDCEEDDEDEEIKPSTSAHTTTNLFPHLHRLFICNMENLKQIGGGVSKGTISVIHGESKVSHEGRVSWSLCQYSQQIEIYDCEALSTVIPSYSSGQMQTIEVLIIERCKSLIEVFETKEFYNNNSGDGFKGMIPRPSNLIVVMHEFPNLKRLRIESCELLEYVFTFSTLESLKQLEWLMIVDCKAMTVIVKEEYGELTTTASTCVVFPHLESIVLDRLPNLTGFFLGTNVGFQMPLLDYVVFNDCPKMRSFTSGESRTPRLMYIHTDLGIHNLECGLNFQVTPTLHQGQSPCLDGINSHPTNSEQKIWSFHNLIRSIVIKNHKLQKIIPSNELQQVQNLETIYAEECLNVECVFEEALEVTNHESHTIVKIPKLRTVELDYLFNLKYIWKNNKWRKLEFPNLTILYIHKCHGLEHVFTSSMVGSVMQLQELHIRDCKWRLKAVVKEEEEEEEEEDCDAKVSEIIEFPCLKFLNLDDLDTLKGFSLGKVNVTLPSLDTLVIKRCPQITFFAEGRSLAPRLRVVETSFGSFQVGEDINAFITTKIQEGYKFGKSENEDGCLF